MIVSRADPVLRDVLTLLRGDSAAGLADADLLRRFVDRADHEAADLAFAAIVARHGPLVLGVCRRALDDPSDVDDAFQSTFLALVRRARSVRVDASLAPWLFAVARRVSLRIRSARLRSRPIADPSTLPDLATAADPDLDDLRLALDDELARLPARFRSPIVLCHLAGHSLDEAARLLDCPVGTVKSRLSRGRARLVAGLSRRGLAPAGGLLPIARLAPVPAPLIRSTLTAASTALPSVSGALAMIIGKGIALACLGIGLAGVTALVGPSVREASDPGRTRTPDGPSGVPPTPDAPATPARPLAPSPGCTWIREPARLVAGETWGVGGEGQLAGYTHVEATSGAWVVVLVHAEVGTRPAVEVRPIAFDAAGKRLAPDGGGSISTGGNVRFSMETIPLPGGSASFGVERVTPEGRRLAAVASRAEAVAAGIPIPSEAKVGERFEFDLPTLDGHRARSADWRGKVVVVVPWRGAFGLRDLVRLQELVPERAGRGLEVLAISFDNEEAFARAMVEQRGFPWPSAYVPSLARTRRIWSEATSIAPGQAFLVDRAGRVNAIGVPTETLGERIDALLDQPAPDDRD